MTENSHDKDLENRSTTAGAENSQSADARLRVLESQVRTLADAIRALARSLEAPPTEDIPMPEETARGARLAHELLLSSGL